jgi:hypothetical protein
MSTTETPKSGERVRLIEGLIEALQNKQSEIALNFHKTSIGIPRLRTTMELNGSISVTVHMRDLTDNEKQAYAQRAVAIKA